MAYLDNLLSRGEQILYVARQHLFVLIANLATELTLIALLVAAGVASNMAFDSARVTFGGITASDLILLICVGISVVVLISGFLDYLRWTVEQYVITDRRVIQVRGLLSRRIIDTPLEKITDVEIQQPFIGRLLNFGTVTFTTAAGEGGVHSLDRITAPLAFQQALLEARQQLERGYGYLDTSYGSVPPTPASVPVEVQRTLEELAALRDRGILSLDEFEAKKRELLRRI